jgi:DNA processing protein
MVDWRQTPGSTLPPPKDSLPVFSARRRALCVWLGSLASWRQGLVKRLVQDCGSISEALDREPRELVDLVVRRGSKQRRSGKAAERRAARSYGERPADGTHRGSEESRFTAILEQPPHVCVQAAESRWGGCAVVAWCDELYPAMLRQLADPPLCLFFRAACARDELVKRIVSLRRRPAVAVVGTRTPSPYGLEMAAILGRDLTSRGILVVSGLAMGIDAAAQAAAVSAGRTCRAPTTVAVLGCGADVVYPRANERLFDEVARTGLLVSEFTWGVPARAWRFPARNRVMAALARGIVVVEGAERSGSLLTADFALDLGREVLAVPGEAGRRLAAAPHGLLRAGASLCESAEDILSAIATSGGPWADETEESRPSAGPAQILPSAPDDCTNPVTRILDSLRCGPMTADQVSQRCGVPVYRAVAALSELEVEGLVRLVDGGVYRLRRE